MGHIHEREMSRHLGHEVRFSPHVAEFFRGIVMTVQMEFSAPVSAAAFRAAYDTAYGDEPLIRIQDEAPEVIEGANNPGAVLGGFALSEDGRRGVMVCALDNLLKGAAVQALQNLCLGLGVAEFEPIGG